MTEYATSPISWTQRPLWLSITVPCEGQGCTGRTAGLPKWSFSLFRPLFRAVMSSSVPWIRGCRAPVGGSWSGGAKARERSYVLPGGLEAELVPGNTELRILKLDHPIGEDYFDSHGHVPLPPYIRREDSSADLRQYQTIFASRPGSVAAPTAGLHINDSLLKQLGERGIQCCELTLHVGPGTFLPVRSEEISGHQMHSEDYEIDSDTAGLITEHKRRGRPVLAVGTTSPAQPGVRMGFQNAEHSSRARQYQALYLSRLQVQGGRCPAYQLSYA